MKRSDLFEGKWAVAQFFSNVPDGTTSYEYTVHCGPDLVKTYSRDLAKAIRLVPEMLALLKEAEPSPPADKEEEWFRQRDQILASLEENADG